jgi:hypothetical protein
MRLALLFSGQGGQRPEHGPQIGADAPAELLQALADCAIDIAKGTSWSTRKNWQKTASPNPSSSPSK